MSPGFPSLPAFLFAALSLSAAPSLRAPATFEGVVTCAGCLGSRLTVTLDKDGVYMLRRTNLEADRLPESRFEIGRWELIGDRLLLRGTPPMEFTLATDSIRTSGGELRRKIQVVSFDETLRLRGIYQNGRFEECLTGKSYPLSTSATRAVASLPGPPRGRSLLMLLAHFESGALVIDAPLRFSPGDTCAAPELQGASPSSVLEGTWDLTQLDGKPMPSTVTRPPYLTFANGKASGFAGCNRFGGSYQTTPASLRFGNLISTQMACPEAAMKIEDGFLQALQRTTASRRAGDEIELLAGERTVARLRKR